MCKRLGFVTHWNSNVRLQKACAASSAHFAELGALPDRVGIFLAKECDVLGGESVVAARAIPASAHDRQDFTVRIVSLQTAHAAGV